MTIRDLRPADAATLLEFLRRDFPEEERLMGTRPDGFDRIVRRVFRWDTRLVLGLLRRFGRPVFRFFVDEEGGRIVATTLLTFGARAGHVSMVAVDPAYRRRGLATQLLDQARRASARRGRRYVALDVLDTNAPARALYERLDYRPLRSTAYVVREAPATPAAAIPTPEGLRPMNRDDADALARIARRQRPSPVAEVLPVSAGEISGSAWVSRILASESAAWVIDPGTGPLAWVSATSSSATEAGHLSAPIVDPSVRPEDAAALVGIAAAWCTARGAPRLIALVADENARGRAALEAAGFHDELRFWTLYRPSA